MKRPWRIAIVVGACAIAAFFVYVLGGWLFMVWAFSHYNASGNWIKPGSAIEGIGEYKLVSGERIQVRIDQDDTVAFEFFAADGHKIISNDNDVHPSATKQWRLFLDSQKWIWLDSADTGPRVWTMYTTGTWPSKPVRGDRELEQLAPNGFAGR